MKIIHAFKSHKTKIKNLIFKNFHLPKIKTIIWDIDGTMYRNAKLGEKIYEEYISFIAKNKRLKKLKSAEILLNTHTATGMTWSQATAKITGIIEKEILKTVGKGIDRKNFLTENPDLISMFSNKDIQRYAHFVLTNSTRKNAIQTLHALGLTEDIIQFKKIISVEDLKHVKPHPSCFEMIFEITNAQAKTHLMVGDDLIADIIPAKKIGMKTCHMYPATSTSYADVQLFDISQLHDFLS